MKKKFLISITVPGFLLASQPIADSPLLLTSPKEIQPTHIIAVVPAVVVGAVVIGGIAWGGLKIANRIMDLWEHRVTNSPPAGVEFTQDIQEESRNAYLEANYPE